MSPQKKAVWVGMILVGGMLLALPFRHTTPPVDHSTENLATTQIWLQKPGWGDETAGNEAESADSKQSELVEIDSPTNVRSLMPGYPDFEDATAPNRIGDLEPIQRRPNIPRPATLGSELTDLPPDVVVVEKPADQLDRREPTPQQTNRNSIRPPMQTDRAPQRPKRKVIKHVVRDGDTLQSLARRYLGDERRALEIYEANQARLLNPEALPIDKELTIIVE